MKKFAFLLAAMLPAVFALSACNNDPRPDFGDRITETNEATEREFKGTIEPLELDIYQDGTHQIRTNDDEVVLIQSQILNLNRYLDREVTVRGTMEASIGDGQDVLNVSAVLFDSDLLAGDQKTYKNKSLGIQFNYPGVWQLDEKGAKVTLSENGLFWVTIEAISYNGDISTFVDIREDSEGSAVTIGAQKSFRFTEGDSIRVYVPNKSKRKVYLIQFNEAGRTVDGQKDIFFDLLESVALHFSAAKSGDKCGGEEGLACEEGFRCELESGEENAEGVCISVTATDSGSECPFIPAPTDCAEFEVAATNANGCPTRYECTGAAGESAIRETEGGFDTELLTQTLSTYAKDFLPVENPSIVQFELTTDENLVAIVYRADESKYKTLYSYKGTARDPDLTEEAHFEEGEERDWDLVRGENLQSGLKRQIISKERDASKIRVVNEGMRLYENTHRDFGIEYPRNWYFRSFGPVSDTLWLVGFGDQPVEEVGDAVVLMSIVEADHDFGTEAAYRLTKPRDDDSQFSVSGPSELRETIQLMLDSIQ